MKQHTLPVMLIGLSIIIAGTWGSMHNVYAGTTRTVSLAAGAAKAPSKIAVSKANIGDSEKKITIEVKADDSDWAKEIGGIPTSKLVMANVQEAVNIREKGDEESSILGKLYCECGGEILEEADNWTKIKTGDVTGWVRNDYLLFEGEAVTLANKVVEKTATCTTETLRVREEPNEEATILSLLGEGDTIGVVEEQGKWVKVEFSDGDVGYVAAEYVSVADELGKGESMETIAKREEQHRKEKEAAAKESKKAGADKAQAAPQVTASTNSGAVAAEVSDVSLLAALIQAEAGNQPYEGQVAIGSVVMNRLRTGRYGGSIYSVIYARGQFGPAASGKVAQIAAAGPNATCVKAAQDALNGVSNIGAATHFRNVSSGYQGVVIGSHVFW